MGSEGVVMEKLKKEEEKKLNDGWIKSTMIIEVLAVNEEAAESALKNARDDLENVEFRYKENKWEVLNSL